MTTLTPDQIRAVAYQAGFRGAGLDNAVRVAEAESGGDTRAYNTQGNSAGADRGLFQFNNYYHSEVNDTCAYDPVCSAQQAYRVSQGGTNWGQWSSWLNGSAEAERDTGKLWFQYGTTQGYGANGETGNDIGTPFHTPISFPFGGTITKLGYYPYGGEVDVQGNIPGIGNITQYIIHLDQISSGLGVGSKIAAGQVIGLSGGENPGFPGGLHPALPAYSSGPHSEYGLIAANGSNPDPTNLVAAIRRGFSGTGSSTASAQMTPQTSALGGVSNATDSAAGSFPFGPIAGGVQNPASGLFQLSIPGLDTLKATVQDWGQRTGLVAAGFILVIIGLIVLFFSTGGYDKLQEATKEAAVVAA